MYVWNVFHLYMWHYCRVSVQLVPVHAKCFCLCKPLFPCHCCRPASDFPLQHGAGSRERWHRLAEHHANYLTAGRAAPAQQEPARPQRQEEEGSAETASHEEEHQVATHTPTRNIFMCFIENSLLTVDLMGFREITNKHKANKLNAKILCGTPEDL